MSITNLKGHEGRLLLTVVGDPTESGFFVLNDQGYGSAHDDFSNL